MSLENPVKTEYNFDQVNYPHKYNVNDIVKSNKNGKLYRIIDIDENKYRMASETKTPIEQKYSKYRDIPYVDNNYELFEAASKGGRKKHVRSTNRKTSHKKRRSNNIHKT
jgi:hypothetical protein